MNGFFPEGSSLNDIEEFMRSVEYNVKKAMAGPFSCSTSDH